METRHKFEIKNEDGVVTMTREDGEVFILRALPHLGGASLYTPRDGDGNGVHLDRSIHDIENRAIKHADAFYRKKDGTGMWNL